MSRFSSHGRCAAQPLISVLVLTCAVALLLPASTWGQTKTLTRERRLALSIGNANYPGNPLQNTENDARAIGDVLKESGFSVDLALNTTLRDMSAAIDRLVSNVQKGDVVLVFYSGHGIQLEGENYLVPIDFQARDEADAKYASYSASRLHDRLTARGARLTILVLDACRDNPYRTVRAVGGGLAPMSPGYGSFIGFATGPGQTADDNRRGRNGTFTTALLDAIRKPGLNLEQVFYEARQGTYQLSNGRQVPWSNSSVIGEFYFRSATGAVTVSPPVPPPPAPAPSPAVVNNVPAPSALGFDQLEKKCAAGDMPACHSAARAFPYTDARGVSYFERACDGGVAAACSDLGRKYGNAWGVTKDRARAKTYHERACNGGSPTGCEDLGDVYESGSLGFPRDSPRGLSLYQRACDLGRASACAQVGNMYSLGMLGEGKRVEANQAFTRACELSDAECWYFGSAYKNGLGVTKDPSRAVEYYRRSCDAKTAVACQSLGELYEKGTGVAMDRAKATDYYRRGCDLYPTGDSCSDLKRLGVKP